MPPSNSQLQLDLFGDPITPKAVNPASVPHRSPFRYPGGKTWLVPHIRTWLRSLPSKPTIFVEPFAGGAIVGLSVAFEKLADRVILVELDAGVAAVWQTIFSDDNSWLRERILTFHMTLDNVQSTMKEPHGSTRELAFKTILKNRTYHGGILAPGSAPIKNGESGRGIGSRWYAKTLSDRIHDLYEVKDFITIIHGDGMAEIQRHTDDSNVALFIDPPYTAGGKNAGKRLYTHNVIDHDQLFAVTANLAGDYLMTYDNSTEIVLRAKRHRMEIRPVAMKNTHHSVMSELLVGRNLDWSDFRINIPADNTRSISYISEHKNNRPADPV